MAPGDNLTGKLRWIFIWQAMVATGVVLIGTLIGSLFLRDVLLQQRLRSEVNSSWALVEKDPALSLPRNSVFNGYFVPANTMPDAVPAPLRTLPPGVHRLSGNERMAVVSERSRGRIYMTITESMTDRLVVWISVLASFASVIGISLISWLAYRRSARIVEPVARLADAARIWQPQHADAELFRIVVRPAHNSHEVMHLGAALARMAERMDAYVQRERDFTRDASHELRTPLTVIGVAAGLLANETLSARGERSLQRIRDATRDMGEVLDVFLILARHPDVPVDAEWVDLAEIAHAEAIDATEQLEGKPIEVAVQVTGDPYLHAPPRVVATIVAQFMRNATRFTESGRIDIEVAADHVSVCDTGIGMDEQALARAFDPFWRADIGDNTLKGLGLPLAQRLAERFGWRLGLESRLGEGTKATLYFS